MRPRFLIMGALLAAFMMALGLLPSPGGALDKPALVRIVSVEIRASAEGQEPGDHFVALSVLYDRNDRVIGHGSISCTRSFENLSTCESTYVLPRGKIMAQGTRHSRRYFVLAIVGGTGLYSNVGGVVDTRMIASRKHRLLFSLEP